MRSKSPESIYEGGAGSRTALNRKVVVGDVFQYLYDFGDDWGHEISVERAYEVKSRRHYPKCLDGARICPPEDVGGASGYERFLEILDDPAHPEYHETLAWAREFWSGIRFGTAEVMPERFDAQSTTWQIQAMLARSAFAQASAPRARRRMRWVRSSQGTSPRSQG